MHVATKLLIKREYAGSYVVEGHSREHTIYISRSVDFPKMWRSEGRWFSSLAEAKAEIFAELSFNEQIGD